MKVKGKLEVNKKNPHAHIRGESKEEYYARLSKLPKRIIGDGGNDTWFHFDELYDGAGDGG